MTEQPERHGVLEIALGEPYAAQMRMMFSMMSEMDPSGIDRVLKDMDHLEACGPIFYPSAYLDGRRFNNIETYRKILPHLKALIEFARELKHEDD